VSISFIDAQGTRRTADLSQAASLSSDCRSGTAADSTPLVLDVTFEQGQRGRILLRNDPRGGHTITGVGGFLPEGTVCTASEELITALQGARQAPARRAPVVALVASLAALGLLILLVAATGLGIGPRPELELADDPDGSHPDRAAPEPEGTHAAH